MSTAKKTSKNAIGPLGGFVALALGPGRALASAVLVLGVFLVAWWVVWQRVGPNVVKSERFLVRLDNLETTPQPEWVPGDVRAEVFQSLQFDGPMNLLDDDLGPRVAEGFARHPWIERVVRVTKLPSSSVQVELDYRRPACVVKVGDRLLAVDHRSILLPIEGISRIELERYPQLVGVDSLPRAIPGEPWGSVRVAGGAAIASALSDVWEDWRLARIVPFSVIAPDGREQVHYSVFTESGTRITWGLPPGVDGPGELSAQAKLAQLKAYYIRHGSFDGRTGPLDLDVRSLPGQ